MKIFKLFTIDFKKFISLMMVLFLVLMIMAPGIPVMAVSDLTPFTVNCDTYPVTDAVNIGADIDGWAYIHHIIITNSDASINQTVTFYKLGDSTTTVTSEFEVDMASTSAAGEMAPIQIPFPIGASPYAVEDLLIRKSSLVSDIKVTVFYR